MVTGKQLYDMDGVIIDLNKLSSIGIIRPPIDTYYTFEYFCDGIRYNVSREFKNEKTVEFENEEREKFLRGFEFLRQRFIEAWRVSNG